MTGELTKAQERHRDAVAFVRSCLRHLGQEESPETIDRVARRVMADFDFLYRKRSALGEKT